MKTQRVKSMEKTSEQAFQLRNEKRKKLAKEKAAPVSLKQCAEKFLDSDTVASQATKAALALVAVTAVTGAVCVAPGLTIVARQYKRFQYYSDKQIRDAHQNLKRRGYVEEVPYRGKPRLHLTKKGEEYFQKMIFEEERLNSEEKWDGKWRFILFDIPMSHHTARQAFRWKMKMLGFYQYQKSVWVYPYPCKEELFFVADHYGIGRFVEIIEATGISDDSALRKHFTLP